VYKSQIYANKLEQGKCARYCEFRQLCRRQVTSRHKARLP